MIPLSVVRIGMWQYCRRNMMVKGLTLFLLCSGLVAGRPYFNEQRAPESLQDLRNIQDAMQESLEVTRAATVCVQLEDGSGTGVIISPDGLVLTAAHVSSGVGQALTLVMEDGTEHEARALGLNADTDAAMVQLEGKGPFPYVPYDKNGDLQLGDWVFSLGHSSGFDKGRGIVTRLGRLVKLSPTTVQSDCVLIGGDSGGPLFDMSGTLIGIHSRVGHGKYDSRHVPIENFLKHWDAMKAEEFIGRGPFAQPREPGSGVLGVGVITAEDSSRLMITSVDKDSPAEMAGLSAETEILEIGGTQATEQLFNETLETMTWGQKLILKWKKGGETGEVSVILGRRKEDA